MKRRDAPAEENEVLTKDSELPYSEMQRIKEEEVSEGNLEQSRYT
jgi:hypothetical protein